MFSFLVLLLFVVVLPPCSKEVFIPGLGFGISGCGFLVHLLAGFLGSFTMVCPPPCKLGGCDGVGFRLGFQFLVGVLLAVPAGFKAFRFLWREGLACVQCGGKLFQRPGLGRLCRFLTLIPCLVLAVFPLPVGGKTLCFLRREVGSGLLQRGKLL